MRACAGMMLAGLTAVLVGCGAPTDPLPLSQGTLLGTVTLVGNARSDFNAGTTTPDDPVAGGVFVRQGGSTPPAADPFLTLRDTCFDTGAAATLFAALGLPLPTGTPTEAGAGIGLQAGSSGSSPYGTLARTAAGQYSSAMALPQTVPATLQVTVPGAGGGFPASSGSLSALGTSGALKRSGFSVSTPPTGSQADLTGDISRDWTPGPVPVAGPGGPGPSSVIIMEFFGAEQRSDHVTCLANDDGQFTFKASDPAYLRLQAHNAHVRFESSARAVARVFQVASNAYLTTIVVDRTVAVLPAGALK